MCTHKYVQNQMAWRCWKPNDFNFEGENEYTHKMSNKMQHNLDFIARSLHVSGTFRIHHQEYKTVVDSH
jgi:hypothetical protein